jgi:hypothetical protein
MKPDNSFPAVVAIVFFALTLQTAVAAPLVQAMPGSYTVGQMVGFTVSDTRIEDGIDSGYYAADFSFSWDPSLFRISTQPLTLSAPLAALADGGGFVSVGATGFAGTPDADNSGTYLVSMLTEPPAASGNVPLFTLSFEALQVSTSAFIRIDPVDGGAYGIPGNGFVGSASASISVFPSPIPEPATWALSSLALLALSGVRRSRR